MSMPRSPRGVDSITLGTMMPRGSITSRVSLIHRGSFGLNLLSIFAPLICGTIGLSHADAIYHVPTNLCHAERHYRRKQNVQRNSHNNLCTVMIAPASGKRKHKTKESGTHARSLLIFAIRAWDFVGDSQPSFQLVEY